MKGPELINKFVGESERAVRQLFARGRASSPCVIFFDELDALVPRRGGDGGGGQAVERVVNQMLTEMDGLEGRRGVFVVAATNRPDMLDPAMMRPGRLDKLLYVPLPAASERAEILAAAARKMPLHPSLSLETVALDPRCNGFSGAGRVPPLLASLYRFSFGVWTNLYPNSGPRTTVYPDSRHKSSVLLCNLTLGLTSFALLCPLTLG